LFLISDEPQQAHLLSYRGMKMGSPPQEVSHDYESSAVSPGLSMAEFMDRYGSDDKCEAAP